MTNRTGLTDAGVILLWIFGMIGLAMLLAWFYTI